VSTIEQKFASPATSTEQRGKFDELRSAGQDLAELIEQHCPNGAEEAKDAIKAVDHAVLLAVAAITRAEA
jgi:hypothetical protein